MSEFDLIARHFSRPSRRGDVLLGVGDDAAVMRMPPDRRLVAAVDTIVEAVHFPQGLDAAAIGHRALAVNLSDMAAMGAEPTWMTLSLSLPARDDHWLDRFAAGLYALAHRFNVDLVGGDTVRGPLSVTVQILGTVEIDSWLTRGGAKPGDAIFMSGVPGEAAAGLAVLQKKMTSPHAADWEQRFLWPEPRVALGRELRQIASAAIDVSDGLLADLGHICRQSGCGARIDLQSLPIRALRESLGDDVAERFALSGGDDYELLFTVSPERMLDAEAAMAPFSGCVPLGRMVEEQGVACFRGGQRVDVPHLGYDHFA